MHYKFGIRLALSALLLCTSQSIWATQEHTGVWLDATTSNFLTDDQTWSYSFEGQLRFVDQENYYELFYLQGKLGYYHGSDLSFSAGYEWVSSSPMEDSASQNIFLEELFWWPVSNENFVIRTRSRLEQVNMLHESEWENRFRQRVSFYFPNVITDKITPTVYEELSVKLNDPDWDPTGETFQKNMWFAGVDVDISRTWFISTGYIQQYVWGKTENSLDHILYFGINYNPAMIPVYNYIK